MKQLLSIRTNILYKKSEKKNETDADEFKKFFELIFLCDKAEYKRTNEGSIIRERGLDETRFVVSEKSMDEFIAQLVQIKEAKDEDLV